MKLTRDKEGNLSFARCIGAGAFSGCIGAFAASPMYMVSLLGPLLCLQLRRFQIVKVLIDLKTFKVIASIARPISRLI